MIRRVPQVRLALRAVTFAVVLAGMSACDGHSQPLKSVGDFAVSVTPRGGGRVYIAVVVYRGTRSAFVTCSVVGFGADGKRLSNRRWGLPLTRTNEMPFAAGAYMRPGERLSISYHLPDRAPEGVKKYASSCRSWRQPPA